MHARLAENLKVLLERSPTLAGRIRQHLLNSPSNFRDLASIQPATDISRRQWVDAGLRALDPEHLCVVLGLGDHVFALRERSDVRFWVVDPSPDLLIHLMTQHAVLPVLLKGRLLVGQSIEETARELSLVRHLTLLPYPGRIKQEKVFFEGLEGELRRRASAAVEARARNRVETLRAKVEPESSLGRLLYALPDSETLSVELVDRFIGRTNRRWTRAERLFVAMNSFK